MVSHLEQLVKSQSLLAQSEKLKEKEKEEEEEKERKMEKSNSASNFFNRIFCLKSNSTTKIKAKSNLLSRAKSQD